MHDDWPLNLAKDGGRRVMNGGNAYEDDLESAPAGPEPTDDSPPAGDAALSCYE